MAAEDEGKQLNPLQNPTVEKSGDGGVDLNFRKPDMVRFPLAKPLVPPQLQLESEHSENSDFGLWQVYAFGGYIVPKWLCGKWKERQNQKRKPDD